MELENKVVCQKSDLLKEIEKRQPEVLVTMGAGDIDTLVEPIKNKLTGQL
jgi:UDP-N-acetylmuramate--alanine ligase